MECEACGYSQKHGWWGQTIVSSTHCRDCHQTWPSSQKWGHCSGCHQTFAGVKAFDAHQRVSEESGELEDDCLCCVLQAMGLEGANNLPAGISFDVSPKTVMERRTIKWGMCWGIRDDDHPWKEGK